MIGWLFCFGLRSWLDFVTLEHEGRVCKSPIQLARKALVCASSVLEWIFKALLLRRFPEHRLLGLTRKDNVRPACDGNVPHLEVKDVHVPGDYHRIQRLLYHFIAQGFKLGHKLAELSTGGQVHAHDPEAWQSLDFELCIGEVPVAFDALGAQGLHYNCRLLCGPDCLCPLKGVLAEDGGAVATIALPILILAVVHGREYVVHADRLRDGGAYGVERILALLPGCDAKNVVF
mmetsp:Transcript_70252/g.194316  ORF Transcript_70252/g.194316 Transcript_70252/m.194316 type:complete len:232 (-) Transcript_70252:90-785(-)